MKKQILSFILVLILFVQFAIADVQELNPVGISTDTRFVDGLLGVGTNVPSSRFEVQTNTVTADGITIDNNNTGDPFLRYQLFGSNILTMGIDNSDGDKFKVGSTALDTSTVMTIDRSIDGAGRIGIRDTTPDSLLDVEGNSNTGEGIIIDNLAPFGDPFLKFQLGGTSLWTLGIDNDDSSKFKVGSTSTDTNTLMTLARNIDSNGRIGIMDTTPDAKLDVQTNVNGSDGVLIDNIFNNTGNPILGFQLSGLSIFTLGVDNNDNDKFKIGTTALTTNTRMMIDNSGQVGIGTTSPSAKLDVDAGTGRGIIEVSGTTGGCLKIADSDGAGFTFCTANNGVLSCSTIAC